jgi:hypothetical protein
MKTWKQKVDIPEYGLCTVKELTDKEANKTPGRAPASHGFVNLYQGKEWVGWCGIFYAQKRIV